METLIWLTEVAPVAGKAGRRFLDHLANANKDANPELARFALKLATGCRQDHRYGDADRLADHQCGTAIQQ